MKNISIFLCFCVLLLAAGCKNAESGRDIPFKENPYVELYPTSVFAKSPILVKLKNGYRLKESVNEESLQKSIRFTPHLGFSVSATSSDIIRIVPDKPLENEAVYKCSIRLGDLVENCSEKNFVFEFSTPVPLFDYNAELKTADEPENTFYIEGIVATTDYVAPSFIEKNVTAGPGRHTLEWNHSEDGKGHTFRSENIPAEKNPFEIYIRRDFSPYSKKGEITDTLRIPAEGSFEVMEIKVKQDPQRIEIFLSTPVEKTAQINNFITLGNVKYKYAADKNKITLYPQSQLSGALTLTIDKGLKNTKGEGLEKDYTAGLSFGESAPVIKFLSKGMLLPPGNNMTILFQAANYAKARVRVKRIFENNLLQFLQDNNEEEGYNLYNVAKTIADTTLVLGAPGSESLTGLLNYGLRLDRIIAARPGDIYRIEIRGAEPLVEEEENAWESDYYFGTYDTYAERSRNIYATNMAMIVKGNDRNEYTVFVTDIMSGRPVQGALVQAFSPVNQLLAEGFTDPQGKISLTTDEEAYTVLASKNNDKSFIKVQKGRSLSVSDFDVGGTRDESGVQAFIFGERGVWRPGDTLHVCVIPYFGIGKTPENYPVVAELYNPKGQLVSSRVENNTVGILAYDFPTSSNALTGRWEVKIKIGNETFSKGLKVETVKPNRLKISLDLENGEYLNPEDTDGEVKVEWLYGAPGRELTCDIKARLSNAATTFKNYADYTFRDFTRTFYTDEYEIASGATDPNGIYRLPRKMDVDFSRAPGFIDAALTVRAFEPSGEFSAVSFNERISPFSSYIGMYIPEEKAQWGDKYLDKNKEHTLRIVTVDARGIPVPVPEADVEIYQVSWRWWWNSAEGGTASYSADSDMRPVKNYKVKLTDGSGTLSLSWKYENYGYYFIRVTDPQSGHACSYTYLVSDADYGNSAAAEGEGSARLSTTLDKESYRVGETALLTIPSAKNTRALVCLEKGGTILKSFWVNCGPDKTIISIPIEKRMLPNIYAYVTLIQPHERTLNDAPIRMYGIQRIKVEDEQSVLYPQLETPDQIKPESELTVGIKEKNGRPMGYVLMVTDEGLLSLTNFKTPDPWKYIYAQQASGITTWDLFDRIIGAYGGKIEQLFAIGGDDELMQSRAPQEGAMRFKPIARVIGPFSLPARGKAVHKIRIPQYIGSVRVMAVATDGWAMGGASRNVAVKKPVMVQATLPRTVATQEEISLPVTLFTLEDNVGKVDISVGTNDKFEVIGASSVTEDSREADEKVIYFKLKAKDTPGTGKITVTAKSSQDVSREDIEINVLNPTPRISTSESFVLKPHEKKSVEFALAGEPQTNTANIEVSTVPSLNLGFRLRYLIDYPHGCLEQITSSAFAQLEVYNFLDNPQLKKQAENNIAYALGKLPDYLLPDGSLSYWPGSRDVSRWGTIYAAQFLLAAQESGYAIPARLKESVFGYLEKFTGKRDNNFTEQAYALYVLTLDRNPQPGAMNRLREETPQLPNDAKWLLSAAYALNNKPSVAKEILKTVGTQEKTNSFSYTFDSPERTTAFALNTYMALGDTDQAFRTAQILSGYLNNPRQYLSTQSTAWCLLTLSDFIRTQKTGTPDVTVIAGQGKYDLSGERTILEREIETGGNQKVTGKGTSAVLPVTIENKGDNSVYCNLTSTGIPAKMEAKAQASGLRLHVEYYDAQGQPLSYANIAQGTDFYTVVTITNTSMQNYTNMVLEQKFASGWEIVNRRINSNAEYPDGITYQDIRDDRIHTYFNLEKQKSISIKTGLTATYRGKFYLPPVSCQAMYDGNVFASDTGSWCTVK